MFPESYPDRGNIFVPFLWHQMLDSPALRLPLKFACTLYTVVKLTTGATR